MAVIRIGKELQRIVFLDLNFFFLGAKRRRGLKFCQYFVCLWHIILDLKFNTSEFGKNISRPPVN